METAWRHVEMLNFKGKEGCPYIGESVFGISKRAPELQLQGSMNPPRTPYSGAASGTFGAGAKWSILSDHSDSPLLFSYMFYTSRSFFFFTMCERSHPKV